MAVQNVYVGRQPILDLNQQVVAYELLFRAGENAAGMPVDGALATAHVIVTAFSELGLENVLGPSRGFINVNREILLHDAIELLPRHQVVLELDEDILGDEEVIARCRTLKQEGFRIAIDSVTTVNDRVTQLLPIADVVKVETSLIAPDELKSLVGALLKTQCLKLAQKVETKEQAEHCRQLGFDLFQGYFFARPTVMSTKRADPGKAGLLRLLTLVLSEAEVGEIEQAFKHMPELSYSLLRMVNSVAGGMSKRIGSLRQAIVVLGRKPLQRWVQLLIYTAGHERAGLGNPLMDMAATRGKTLELLALKAHASDREYADNAFMVGILSLLDALLEMPIKDIVAELKLEDEIAAALLHRSGRLGGLLRLVEAKERDDVEAVVALLEPMTGLSMGELVTADLHASTWARDVNHPAAT